MHSKIERIRAGLGDVWVGRSRVPISGPLIVLEKPQGPKRQEGFHARDAPELLGPFHRLLNNFTADSVVLEPIGQHFRRYVG